ncbi:hypothetical protein KR009_000739, partial [Drosophila setifemur]
RRRRRQHGNLDPPSIQAKTTWRVAEPEQQGNIWKTTIIMKDSKTIKQRCYPKNPAMKLIINVQVYKLLRQGCVEPSWTPHSATYI